MLLAEETKALEAAEAAEADAAQQPPVDVELLRTLLETLPSHLYHRIRRTTLEMRLDDAHEAMLMRADIPGDGVLLLHRRGDAGVTDAVRIVPWWTPFGMQYVAAELRWLRNHTPCAHPWELRWDVVYTPMPSPAAQVANILGMHVVYKWFDGMFMLLERHRGVIRAQMLQTSDALQAAFRDAVHRLMTSV